MFGFKTVGQLLAGFNTEEMNRDVERPAAFCCIPTAPFKIPFLVFYMISLFLSPHQPFRERSFYFINMKRKS